MSKRERPIIDFLTNEIPGLLRALKTLGISRRELEIYAELVTQGELTAKELANRLGLPISKVYESLSQLIEKRWVTRSMGRPYRYEPVPIRTIWTELKRGLTESMSLIEDKVVPLLEEWSTSPSGVFRVTLIGRDRIPYYAQRILERSVKEKVRVALAHEELFELVTSILQRERLVESKLSVLIDERIYEKISTSRLRSFLDIRVAGRMYGSGIIGEEILLVVGEGNSLQGFWSDHEYLVELGKGYFDYIWSSSRQWTLSP